MGGATVLAKKFALDFHFDPHSLSPATRFPMLESLFSPGWYGRYQGWAVFHTMPFADKAYRDTKHGDPDGVNHGADEEVTRHVTCCQET